MLWPWEVFLFRISQNVRKVNGWWHFFWRIWGEYWEKHWATQRFSSTDCPTRLYKRVYSFEISVWACAVFHTHFTMFREPLILSQSERKVNGRKRKKWIVVFFLVRSGRFRLQRSRAQPVVGHGFWAEAYSQCDTRVAQFEKGSQRYNFLIALCRSFLVFLSWI